jgi:DNA-binding MarR family transcriptional regulator
VLIAFAPIILRYLLQNSFSKSFCHDEIAAVKYKSMEPIDRVAPIIAAQEREFPHLDFSAKGIAGRLVRLGTLFIDAIERIVGGFGLSANEYVILCVLRVGSPKHTLPPKAINPLMNLTSGGLTNILHALEQRGLVERLPDPSDRRGVLIRMTPAAVKLIDQAIAAHVAEEQRMVAALSSSERNALRRLLSKLLGAIEPVPARTAGTTRTTRAGAALAAASTRRLPSRAKNAARSGARAARQRAPRRR